MRWRIEDVNNNVFVGMSVRSLSEPTDKKATMSKEVEPTGLVCRASNLGRGRSDLDLLRIDRKFAI